MIYQKYIAICYRVYQHKRQENASFLTIFNGGGRRKWRFSNFPRFSKDSSTLGSFNCIFENNSLKALFGQNLKKLKILKLALDFRYLQKVALKCLNWPFFHISQCFLQKRSQILTLPPPPPTPRVDHGSTIKVARLLGQGFLEKIQNGGRRFTLR